MEAPLAYVWRQQMERTAKALRANNMDAYCVDTAAEVAPLVRSLLHKGDTVSVGGSVTLEQCGIVDLLRNGEYKFLDRYAPGLSAEDTADLFRRSFFADCYLSSSNAVTMNGELFNADRRANRVAALCYGPKSVILVVGCNKIVPDIAAAQRRLETLAAPANARRLACSTPCAQTGVCADCKSPARICCTYVVHRYQRVAGRIKVILVGEPLGY